MRCLLRRVTEARVEVEKSVVGQIKTGLLLYLGIHHKDSSEDLDWITKKILGIRIFEDRDGKINSPISESEGILVVSQFTLFGNLKKGFRPSFHRAAPPQDAQQIYKIFLGKLENEHPGPVQSGVFGADMSVFARDDGPVTIWLDSSNKDY